VVAQASHRLGDTGILRRIREVEQKYTAPATLTDTHELTMIASARTYACLFPLPVTATPEEVILHLPRCMIGGLTQRACTQASRLLGFVPLENGRLALAIYRLCLKCLHVLFTHFQSLKPF